MERTLKAANWGTDPDDVYERYVHSVDLLRKFLRRVFIRSKLFLDYGETQFLTEQEVYTDLLQKKQAKFEHRAKVRWCLDLYWSCISH